MLMGGDERGVNLEGWGEGGWNRAAAGEGDRPEFESIQRPRTLIGSSRGCKIVRNSVVVVKETRTKAREMGDAF